MTSAVIHIDPHTDAGQIHPHIYGHFLESAFFGNIEEGLLDEHGNARDDVTKLCTELGVPIVRWPGGNFTSPYHWEDGIGPRAQRPRRLELAWGSEEPNQFGTDEYLAWCEAVGAEPFLVHSCRSVDEAVRWIEYTNHAGDTDYTRQRAHNGHPEPYGVRYWGIGNEVYAKWQMGYRSAEEYAAAAREHAQFMRSVDPSIRLIAVGSPWRPEEWATHLLQRAGRLIDYVSIHLYAASTHLFEGDDYDAVVSQPLYFGQQIAAYSHLIADLARTVGVDRPLGLALDEWNIRHLEPASRPEPQPSADGGVEPREAGARGGPGLRVNRWSPRTLADALFYAGVFHELHRAAALPVPVTMANTVNLINANGLVVARPGVVVKSASYHVWDLFQRHSGTAAVATRVEAPGRTMAIRHGDQREPDGSLRSTPGVVPYLDASATTSVDGLHVTVINRHRTDAITAHITGVDSTTATVHDIGADVDDLFAVNTADHPDTIGIRERGTHQLDDGRYTFPPHSITALTFRT